MLEDDSKAECKSPRLQQEFNKIVRAGSPSFLARRMAQMPGSKPAPLSSTNKPSILSPNGMGLKPLGLRSKF